MPKIVQLLLYVHLFYFGSPNFKGRACVDTGFLHGCRSLFYCLLPCAGHRFLTISWCCTIIFHIFLLLFMVLLLCYEVVFLKISSFPCNLIDVSSHFLYFSHTFYICILHFVLLNVRKTSMIIFSLNPGKLVMIVGAVGSGKSSLLSAIIQEMTTMRGNIYFNK